jgi:hypothetical protein
MGELNKREMIIRYGALGLTLGFAILLGIYVLLFQIIDEPFSFQVLGSLHARLGFLFLCDSLPFLATLVGALLGRWRFRQISSFTLRVQSQTEKNQEMKRFTQSLIAGDLNASFTHAEADQTLSNSLNALRDTLVKNREMERQRRLDERQRNWVSHGLAEFGDILRANSDNLETMAYAAISGLVRYLDANQGAIYIANDEETQLQMIACHAYDRKKFPDKVIPWGG